MPQNAPSNLVTPDDQTTLPPGFTQTGLQPVPAGADGTPTAPAVATNPYDIEKLLGKAPDLKAAFAPTAPVGSFQETPGGGQGMGHFVTQDDLRAHETARKAAADYLALASHIRNLHNETQADIDTAGAHQALIGFDHTKPGAAENLAQIRSQFPFAKSEAFSLPDRLIEQQNAQTVKQPARNQADFEKELANMGLTPEAFRGAAVTNAGTYKNGQWKPLNESEGATHMQVTAANKTGKKVTVPMSIADFYRLKNEAINGVGTTATPTAVATPGQKGFKPDKQQQQSFEVDHSSAAQWLRDNPNDPRAKVVSQRLEALKKPAQ